MRTPDRSFPPWTILGVAVAALLVPVVGLLLAVMASRPKLLRALGWVSTEIKSPEEFGLVFDDVEYQAGLRGWWIPADDAVAAVVIVHGLETSDDPRSTDPGPRLEMAAALRNSGYSCLVINLGYATGAHPYSAGALEAEDIEAAVRWAKEQSGLAVALIGMSAGGHAAIAAVQRGCGVFAVVTDGSFVDGAAVIIDQATNLHPLLWASARLVPVLMRLLNGTGPLDLSNTGSAGCPTPHLALAGIPMLHIHGGADTAINPANAGRLAEITGGTAWIVPEAEHVRSYQAAPAEYQNRVLDFLARHRPGVEIPAHLQER